MLLQWQDASWYLFIIFFSFYPTFYRRRASFFRLLLYFSSRKLKPKNSTNSTVCCPMFYEIFWCHLFIYATIKCSLRNRTTFLNFKIFDFLPELKTFCSFLFWGWKFTTLLHHYKTYFHAPTGNYWWMR